MRKKIKKAFTLVELLVVIAILAILATVSIVGYNSFTKKAKVSNDTALVSQLNTLLKADSMVNGDAKTPTDALKITSEAGYDVEKLTPTASDYDIIWNQKTNQFALLDEKGTAVYGEKSTEEYKNWKFVSEYNANSTYSMYLKNNTSTKSIDNLNVGLDVGTNINITEVNYTNSEAKDDVVIRTNGGTLTINGERDTVSHYGNAITVDVQAVANNSYHEYGEVLGNIEITKGRVALEKESKVSTILVNSKAANDVKVDVVAGASVGSVAPTTEAAKSDIKASSTIPTDSMVEEVVDTTKTSLFAGGLGTEKSPYLISNAEEFKSISEFSMMMQNGSAFYYKLINNIDLSTSKINDKYMCQYFCGTLDGNNNNLILNDSIDGVFGDATNIAVFKNLNIKLHSNPVKLCAGSNYKTGAKIILNNVSIDSLNANESINIGQNVGIFFNRIGFDEISQKWCDNHRTNLKIENCSSSVNIIGESYNAVFVGGMLNNADVIVMDSIYSGQYYGEQINLVYGNTCSDNSWDSYVNSTMTIKNVKNTGAMYGTKRAALIAGGASNDEANKHTTIENCDLGTTRELSDSSLGIKIENNSVVINKATSSTSYYVLTFVGGGRRTGEYTINSSYRFSIRLENLNFGNENTYETSYKIGKMVTIEQYMQIDSNSKFEIGTGNKLENEKDAEYWIKEFNGEVYYVFSFKDSYYHFESSNNVAGPALINQVLVTIYDASDKPIAQKSCNR